MMSRYANLLLLAMLASAAQGQDAGAIDTLIVTASRLPSSAAATPFATVLSAADIAARRPANVTELLRQVPGVQVIAQGGRGGLASVIVRGGESNFTVVTIDGVRVNDPTNTRGGSFDFSTLDIQSIQRIEIVRGPLSPIIGGDALAGVIAITTRRGDKDPTKSFSLGLGKNSRQRAAVALRGPAGDAGDYALHLSQVDDGEAVVGDAYEDLQLTAKAGLRHARGKIVVATRLVSFDASGFPEDSGGDELAQIRELGVQSGDEKTLSITADWAFADVWKLDLNASRFARDDSQSSPGIAQGAINGVPPNSSDNTFDRDSVSATATYVGQHFATAAGMEWQREDGTSQGLLDFGVLLPTDFELSRVTRSVFAEFRTDLGSAQLNVGARHDDAGDPQTTLRFGLTGAWLNDTLRWHMGWSEAYKLPSFFALAHPIVGNPELVPETARSGELALAGQLNGQGDWALTVFESEYRNLIDFDPIAFTNVNRSRVKARGVEFSVQLPIRASLELAAHLSYVNTVVLDVATELRGRPQWRGGMTLHWQPSENWDLSLGVLRLTEFYESSVPTGLQLLDGYTRFDLSSQFKVTNALQLMVALDNAGGTSYQEAIGFAAPKRYWRAELRYTF